MNCRGCQNRELGCHSTCEIYKAYREELKEKKLSYEKWDEYTKYANQNRHRTEQKYAMKNKARKYK